MNKEINKEKKEWQEDKPALNQTKSWRMIHQQRRLLLFHPMRIAKEVLLLLLSSMSSIPMILTIEIMAVMSTTTHTMILHTITTSTLISMVMDTDILTNLTKEEAIQEVIQEDSQVKVAQVKAVQDKVMADLLKMVDVLLKEDLVGPAALEVPAVKVVKDLTVESLVPVMLSLRMMATSLFCLSL